MQIGGPKVFGVSRDAVEGAVEDAGEAVEGAAEEVMEATEEAVEGATDEVMEATDEAVEGATEEAAEATEEAGEATEEAAEATEEAAADADAAMADDEGGMAALLTADGFDAEKVVGMIEGSDLSAVQKTALSAAVNAAKDNPALLEATLTRLKEALGM